MAIYFDLEFYVPPEDQDSSHTLKVNPAKEEHILLGGVIYTGELPTKFNPSHAQNLWIWNFKEFDPNDLLQAERKLLEIIYKIFNGQLQDEGIVKTVGIGTARFDLPALFTRSLFHKIAPKDELYRVFLTGFPVDLSVAGVGFMDYLEYGLEPVPANQLFAQYGIDFEKNKGSSVWNLFEDKQFHLIESRTQKEVENTVLLYEMMEVDLN